MSASWPAILMHPAVAPVVVMGLHALDYYFTLWAASLYHAGANRIYNLSGSYELNPFFQKVIDKQRWFSMRFLLTLLLVGALFFLVAWGTKVLSDEAVANSDANAEETRE